MTNFEVYSLVVGANLSFSTASMVFSIYSQRFSSMWINQIKVMIATLAFVIAMFVTKELVPIKLFPAVMLLLSGFSGLCIGDIFLFRAFATLGAGRTLVVYSFQPLLLGIYGYFFLNQLFTFNQSLAVFCMVVCIFIFMFERNKMTGTWDIRSFVWAILGVTLDAIGVMLTRSAYEAQPNLETFEVNVIRCVGALIGFFLISPKSYLVVVKDMLNLRRSEQSLVVGAAIAGSFLSLTMYLAALKYAHVGTMTAITITGPVWVSMLESMYYKRLPNKFQVGAFAFFLLGFYLMLV